MQALCTNRVHNLAWEEDARSGAFVARAARFMLHAQVEAGAPTAMHTAYPAVVSPPSAFTIN